MTNHRLTLLLSLSLGFLACSPSMKVSPVAVGHAGIAAAGLDDGQDRGNGADLIDYVEVGGVVSGFEPHG